MADTERTCTCGKSLTLVTDRSWKHSDGRTYRHPIALADGQPGAPTLAEDAEQLRRIVDVLPAELLGERAALRDIADRLATQVAEQEEG